MATHLRSSFETRVENGKPQFKNPTGEWVNCTAEVKSALEDAWDVCNTARQGSGRQLKERARVVRACGFKEEAGFMERKADGLLAQEPKPY